MQTGEPWFEANFDGLVGPTHTYAGLSKGNVACTQSSGRSSNPRAAALQGLQKMERLVELGCPQGILLPLERPSIPWLRRLGFRGKDAQVLEKAAKHSPMLLAAAASASSMWAANAATVIPSMDSADGRLHLVSANLVDRLHRAHESEETYRVLQAIFGAAATTMVHPPLPASSSLGDEGAANHSRIVLDDGEALHLFVYGQQALLRDGLRPKRFPARQSLEASRAVSRLGRLSAEQTLFIQQSPDVIDQGVFHNDVIAVGHRSFLMAHERAYVEGPQRDALCALRRRGLHLRWVRDSELSVADAVESYVFNTQLIDDPSGGIRILAPLECRENPRAHALLEGLVSEEGPVQKVEYWDLRQSMRNGGGPACLRLRVPMRRDEQKSVVPRVWMNKERLAEVRAWVERHYRDSLCPDDLADPQLLDESRTALDELTQLLELPSLYPFQQG